MTVLTTLPPLTIIGDHDEKTLGQLRNCASYGDVFRGALMADGHFGYSQPVGGVLAYHGQVSVSGVGYDIACGNKAVRTNLTYGEVQADLPRIADAMFASLAFGVGRTNMDRDAQDHELFQDAGRWNELYPTGVGERMRKLAREQLGTIGGGNHYVDLFVEVDDTGRYTPNSSVWIGNHFGSRGFGWKTANGYLNMAKGSPFNEEAFFGREVKGELAQDEPILVDIDTEHGQRYLRSMALAGEYAYAGRDIVIDRVLKLLGAISTFEVHAHHNFSWEEEHYGETVHVARKGSTPLFPGQMSFIGGSMCDEAVIVKGREGDLWQPPSLSTDIEAHGVVETWDLRRSRAESLFSTVHGAGRQMGRIEAAGRRNRRTGELVLDKETGLPKKPGKVSPEMMMDDITAYGIELRGAGLEESSFAYRKLRDVLAHHAPTTEVLHRLRPIVVCMAPDNTLDPYKGEGITPNQEGTT